jgi:hypothetical protein
VVGEEGEGEGKVGRGVVSMDCGDLEGDEVGSKILEG